MSNDFINTGSEEQSKNVKVENGSLKQQEELIRSFMETFDNPSYREMAQIASIQTTRMFRLINGAPMKLEEYLKIKDCLYKRQDGHGVFDELALECALKLDTHSLEKIIQIMRRRLSLVTQYS